MSEALTYDKIKELVAIWDNRVDSFDGMINKQDAILDDYQKYDEPTIKMAEDKIRHFKGCVRMIKGCKMELLQMIVDNHQ